MSALTDISINQILTADETQAAMKLWKSDRASFARRVRDELIAPNIARINRAVGRDNDPDFLAQVVTYVFVTTAG